MKRIFYSPAAVVKVPNIFGDGSDGDVTVSTTITLTRDMYYRNLTVTSAGIINTDGYRIYCTQAFRNAGIVRSIGGNASGITGGTAPGFGRLGNTSSGSNGRNTVGNGAAGGAVGFSFSDSLSTGGVGGSVTGGNGGNSGQPTNSTGGENIVADFQNIVSAITGHAIIWPFASTVPWSLSGGSSGGSGGLGTGASGSSGGGGAGGGIVIIAANIVSNTGTISAAGGNGGNASGTGNIGGGGGGGGGQVFITGLQVTEGTINLAGGSAGTGVGTQLTPAAAGSAGFSQVYRGIS